MNKNYIFSIILVLFGVPYLSAMNVLLEQRKLQFPEVSQQSKDSKNEYLKLSKQVSFDLAAKLMNRLSIDRVYLLLFYILFHNFDFSCNQKCELMQLVRRRDTEATFHCMFDAVERLLMRGFPFHEITELLLKSEMARFAPEGDPQICFNLNSFNIK